MTTNPNNQHIKYIDMRRNTFTGDIIHNGLNLEMLFKMIIYFIEIGKLKFPLGKPFMRISLHTD
jgi:hypothetical protein